MPDWVCEWSCERLRDLDRGSLAQVQSGSKRHRSLVVTHSQEGRESPCRDRACPQHSWGAQVGHVVG